MTGKERAIRRKMSRKLDILERDGPFCYWCERRTDIYAPRDHPLYCTLEHVLARSQGGTHDPDNLRIACRECNNQKDSWAPTPWIKVKEKIHKIKSLPKMKVLIDDRVWHQEYLCEFIPTEPKPHEKK
jgi:5-methylcytosine-specific restriction endonuclease McrA